MIIAACGKMVDLRIKCADDLIVTDPLAETVIHFLREILYISIPLGLGRDCMDIICMSFVLQG